MIFHWGNYLFHKTIFSVSDRFYTVLPHSACSQVTGSSSLSSDRSLDLWNFICVVWLDVTWCFSGFCKLIETFQLLQYSVRKLSLYTFFSNIWKDTWSSPTLHQHLAEKFKSIYKKNLNSVWSKLSQVYHFITTISPANILLLNVKAQNSIRDLH